MKISPRTARKTKTRADDEDQQLAADLAVVKLVEEVATLLTPTQF
jgi:hypothetical protein